MYRQKLMINIISSIFGIIVGLLLIFSEAEDFLRFVFSAISIYLFCLAIPSLVTLAYHDNKKEKNRVMVIAIVLILIGAILLIYPTTVATIIAGVCLLGVPIYNIVIAYNKKEAFKKEWIKLALGTILILCGIGSVVKVLLLIIGVAIIVLSGIYLIINIIKLIMLNKKDKQDLLDSEVIDV